MSTYCRLTNREQIRCRSTLKGVVGYTDLEEVKEVRNKSV